MRSSIELSISTEIRLEWSSKLLQVISRFLRRNCASNPATIVQRSLKKATLNSFMALGWMSLRKPESQKFGQVGKGKVHEV